MGLKTYRELDVWQKSMDLVVAVYELTRKFPADEKFGLTSQLRRAAVSIPANIAEGYARKHRGDYVHHLSVAAGSAAEVETHVTISVRLGFVSKEGAMAVWNLTQEVARMLSKLIQSLENAKRPPLDAKPRTLNPKP